MDYVFKSKEDLHTQHFFKFRNLWKSKDDFFKEENIFCDDFTVVSFSSLHSPAMWQI